MTLDRDTVATAVMRAVKLDDKVPREKWYHVVERTALGVAFAVLTVYGAARWSWPWYATVPMSLLAGSVWSGRVMGRAFGTLFPWGERAWKAFKAGKDA